LSKFEITVRRFSYVYAQTGADRALGGNKKVFFEGGKDGVEDIIGFGEQAAVVYVD
jgi:hypothetical protein